MKAFYPLTYKSFYHANEWQLVEAFGRFQESNQVINKAKAARTQNHFLMNA